MSLSTLFEEIYSINPAFKKIVLNVGIIIDINHKDNKFDKPKNEFLLFYSKTITIKYKYLYSRRKKGLLVKQIYFM